MDSYSTDGKAKGKVIVRKLTQKTPLNFEANRIKAVAFHLALGCFTVGINFLVDFV